MLTPEQKQERRNGLGGSDIGAVVLQYNYDFPLTYLTPLEVYLSKVDDSYVKNTNNCMKFGNIIEEFLIKMFTEETGLEVTTGHDTKYSEEHPHLLANIDGFIPSENAVLEIKNVDPSKAYLWGPEDSDEIPEAYLLQVAHYVHVYNADRAYIAAYFGGSRFKIYVYERNMDLEGLLVKESTRFWNEHVIKRIPPDPEKLEDYRNLYPVESSDDRVLADDITKDIIRVIKENMRRIKELEEENIKFKEHLCSQIKSDTTLIGDEGEVLATWKTQKTKRLDTEQFRKSYPDIAEEVTKMTQTRVLRIR